MAYTRYRFASELCRGRRVLEVACGQGVGLGYLARHAREVVGGDLTDRLLRDARHTLRGSPSLVRMDAQALPLGSASMDVIVCFEALYFFEHPAKFLKECRRVLTPQGLLLLCTVNPEWRDFNPSSYGHRYHSARQLSALLQESGFRSDLFGAFPVVPVSRRASLVLWLKRVAVALHLIPSTMAGKRLLKRIFLGKLISFPRVVDDGMAPYAQPQPISSDQPVTGYKVLFAVGRTA